jgi:hypothetical protein
MLWFTGSENNRLENALAPAALCAVHSFPVKTRRTPALSAPAAESENSSTTRRAEGRGLESNILQLRVLFWVSATRRPNKQMNVPRQLSIRMSASRAA